MYDIDINLVNEKWKMFKETMMAYIEKFIPIKIISLDNEKPMWWNKEAGKAVKNKACAWKRYLANKSNHNYREYVKVRNHAAKTIRKIKVKFEKMLGKNAKKNKKLFYKYANSKNKARIPVVQLKKGDEEYTDNDKECSDVLNNYFKSVFNEEGDRDLLFFNDFAKMVFMDEMVEPLHYTGPVEENSVADFEVDINCVLNLLRKQNPHKTMGPDKLHARILKELAEQIAEPLTHIYNASIKSGKVPDEWKHALVSAIFKKGDRNLPSNYRPISLTCHVCKILEKIIRDKIMQHLEANNVICSHQHGFCKSKSCLTNLLEAFEDWSLWDDTNARFDAVFLDFQKAFDSVPHVRLIYKLNKLGIRGRLLNWIEDFLRNRRQRVVVNGSESDWREVTSGVPQGSVIGPLLFICYINDLPSVMTGCECKIFADDCKVYRKIETTEDYNILQKNLDLMSEWSKEYMLYFNPKKCVVMHLGRNNPNKVYSIEDQILDKTEEEKDLGVIINKNFSFSTHINKSISKANQSLGIMQRTFTYMDEELFRDIYLPFVRPHLEYCVQVWSPYLRCEVDKIEKVQRRATKLVPSLHELPYEERLKKLNLTTLEERRHRGDQI